jgi:hypothetical protein
MCCDDQNGVKGGVIEHYKCAQNTACCGVVTESFVIGAGACWPLWFFGWLGGIISFWAGLIMLIFTSLPTCYDQCGSKGKNCCGCEAKAQHTALGIASAIFSAIAVMCFIYSFGSFNPFFILVSLAAVIVRITMAVISLCAVCKDKGQLLPEHNPNVISQPNTTVQIVNTRSSFTQPQQQGSFGNQQPMMIQQQGQPQMMMQQQGQPQMMMQQQRQPQMMMQQQRQPQQMMMQQQGQPQMMMQQQGQPQQMMMQQQGQPQQMMMQQQQPMQGQQYVVQQQQPMQQQQQQPMQQQQQQPMQAQVVQVGQPKSMDA